MALRPAATCPGALIVHTDGTIASCTLDALDDDEGCHGRDLPHAGTPMVCWRTFDDGCLDCGVLLPG